MVKFGDYLQAEMAVEWKDKYIEYSRLKALLKALHPDVTKKGKEKAVRALTLLNLQNPPRRMGLGGPPQPTPPIPTGTATAQAPSQSTQSPLVPDAGTNHIPSTPTLPNDARAAHSFMAPLRGSFSSAVSPIPALAPPQASAHLLPLPPVIPQLLSHIPVTTPTAPQHPPSHTQWIPGVPLVPQRPHPSPTFSPFLSPRPSQTHIAALSLSHTPLAPHAPHTPLLLAQHAPTSPIPLPHAPTTPSTLAAPQSMASHTLARATQVPISRAHAQATVLSSIPASHPLARPSLPPLPPQARALQPHTTPVPMLPTMPHSAQLSLSIPSAASGAPADADTTPTQALVSAHRFSTPIAPDSTSTAAATVRVPAAENVAETVAETIGATTSVATSIDGTLNTFPLPSRTQHQQDHQHPLRPLQAALTTQTTQTTQTGQVVHATQTASETMSLEVSAQQGIPEKGFSETEGIGYSRKNSASESLLNYSEMSEDYGGISPFIEPVPLTFLPTLTNHTRIFAKIPKENPEVSMDDLSLIGSVAHDLSMYSHSTVGGHMPDLTEHSYIGDPDLPGSSTSHHAAVDVSGHRAVGGDVFDTSGGVECDGSVYGLSTLGNVTLDSTSSHTNNHNHNRNHHSYNSSNDPTHNQTHSHAPALLSDRVPSNTTMSMSNSNASALTADTIGGASHTATTHSTDAVRSLRNHTRRHSGGSDATLTSLSSLATTAPTRDSGTDVSSGVFAASTRIHSDAHLYALAATARGRASGHRRGRRHPPARVGEECGSGSESRSEHQREHGQHGMDGLGHVAATANAAVAGDGASTVASDVISVDTRSMSSVHSAGTTTSMSTATAMSVPANRPSNGKLVDDTWENISFPGKSLLEIPDPSKFETTSARGLALDLISATGTGAPVNGTVRPALSSASWEFSSDWESDPELEIPVEKSRPKIHVPPVKSGSVGGTLTQLLDSDEEADDAVHVSTLGMNLGNKPGLGKSGRKLSKSVIFSQMTDDHIKENPSWAHDTNVTKGNQTHPRGNWPSRPLDSETYFPKVRKKYSGKFPNNNDNDLRVCRASIDECDTKSQASSLAERSTQKHAKPTVPTQIPVPTLSTSLSPSSPTTSLRSSAQASAASMRALAIATPYTQRSTQSTDSHSHSHASGQTTQTAKTSSETTKSLRETTKTPREPAKTLREAAKTKALHDSDSDVHMAGNRAFIDALVRDNPDADAEEAKMLFEALIAYNKPGSKGKEGKANRKSKKKSEDSVFPEQTPTNPSVRSGIVPVIVARTNIDTSVDVGTGMDTGMEADADVRLDIPLLLSEKSTAHTRERSRARGSSKIRDTHSGIDTGNGTHVVLLSDMETDSGISQGFARGVIDGDERDDVGMSGSNGGGVTMPLDTRVDARMARSSSAVRDNAKLHHRDGAPTSTVALGRDHTLAASSVRGRGAADAGSTVYTRVRTSSIARNTAPEAPCSPAHALLHASTYARSRRQSRTRQHSHARQHSQARHRSRTRTRLAALPVTLTLSRQCTPLHGYTDDHGQTESHHGHPRTPRRVRNHEEHILSAGRVRGRDGPLSTTSLASASTAGLSVTGTSDTSVPIGAMSAARASVAGSSDAPVVTANAPVRVVAQDNVDDLGRHIESVYVDERGDAIGSLGGSMQVKEAHDVARSVVHSVADSARGCGGEGVHGFEKGSLRCGDEASIPGSDKGSDAGSHRSRVGGTATHISTHARTHTRAHTPVDVDARVDTRGRTPGRIGRGKRHGKDKRVDAAEEEEEEEPRQTLQMRRNKASFQNLLHAHTLPEKQSREKSKTRGKTKVSGNPYDSGRLNPAQNSLLRSLSNHGKSAQGNVSCSVSVAGSDDGTITQTHSSASSRPHQHHHHPHHAHTHSHTHMHSLAHTDVSHVRTSSSPSLAVAPLSHISPNRYPAASAGARGHFGHDEHPVDGVHRDYADGEADVTADVGVAAGRGSGRSARHATPYSTPSEKKQVPEKYKTGENYPENRGRASGNANSEAHSGLRHSRLSSLTLSSMSSQQSLSSRQSLQQLALAALHEDSDGDASEGGRSTWDECGEEDVCVDGGMEEKASVHGQSLGGGGSVRSAVYRRAGATHSVGAGGSYCSGSGSGRDSAGDVRSHRGRDSDCESRRGERSAAFGVSVSLGGSASRDGDDTTGRSARESVQGSEDAQSFWMKGGSIVEEEDEDEEEQVNGKREYEYRVDRWDKVARVLRKADYAGEYSPDDDNDGNAEDEYDNEEEKENYGVRDHYDDDNADDEDCEEEQENRDDGDAAADEDEDEDEDENDERARLISPSHRTQLHPYLLAALPTHAAHAATPHAPSLSPATLLSPSFAAADAKMLLKSLQARANAAGYAGPIASATSYYVSHAEAWRAAHKARSVQEYADEVYDSQRIRQIYTNPLENDPDALPTLTPRVVVEQQLLSLPTLDEYVPRDAPHYVSECVFLEAVQAQLDKTNDFCLTLEEYYHEHLRKCAKMAEEMVQVRGDAETLPVSYRRSKRYAHAKNEFTEVYRGLHLLGAYQMLNLTGFYKILKKHDKQSTGWPHCLDACLPTVFGSHLGQSTAGDRMLRHLDRLYVRAFGKDKHREMRVLLDTALQYTTERGLRLGVYAGIVCTLLVAVVLLSALFPEHTVHTPHFNAAFPAFAALTQVTVQVWLWALVAFTCASLKINYALVLQLNLKTYMGPLSLLEVACILSVLLLALLAVFMVVTALDPWSSGPFYMLLAAHIALVMGLCWPGAGVYRPTRWFLVKTIGRFLSSPFTRATTQETFVGNFVSSSKKVFQDLAYSWCFFSSYDYSSGSVYDSTAGGLDAVYGMCKSEVRWYVGWFSMYPALMRCMQCLRLFYKTRTPFPFLVNAGKYTFSFSSSLFSWLSAVYPDIPAFYYLWLVLAACSSLYSWVWDTTMDWQLFNRHAAARKYYSKLVEDAATHAGARHGVYAPLVGGEREGEAPREGEEENGENDRENDDNNIDNDSDSDVAVEAFADAVMVDRDTASPTDEEVVDQTVHNVTTGGSSDAGTKTGSAEVAMEMVDDARLENMDRAANKLNTVARPAAAPAVMSSAASASVGAVASAQTLTAVPASLLRPPPPSAAPHVVSPPSPDPLPQAHNAAATGVDHVQASPQTITMTSGNRPSIQSTPTLPTATQPPIAVEMADLTQTSRPVGGDLGLRLIVTVADTPTNSGPVIAPGDVTVGATPRVPGLGDMTTLEPVEARGAPCPTPSPCDAISQPLMPLAYSSSSPAPSPATMPLQLPGTQRDAAKVLLRGVGTGTRIAWRILGCCGSKKKKEGRKAVLTCLLPADLLQSFFLLNRTMILYYFFVLLNFFLRAIWIVNADPMLYLGVTSDARSFALGLLEQTRRAIWAYLRLESEHVKNVQSGKAVNLSGLQYSKTGTNMQFVRGEHQHHDGGWGSPWLRGDYGFPLGYEGVADAYERELIVEGDNGFYYIEPLVQDEGEAEEVGEVGGDADSDGIDRGGEANGDEYEDAQDEADEEDDAEEQEEDGDVRDDDNHVYGHEDNWEALSQRYGDNVSDEREQSRYSYVADVSGAALGTSIGGGPAHVVEARR